MKKLAFPFCFKPENGNVVPVVFSVLRVIGPVCYVMHIDCQENFMYISLIFMYLSMFKNLLMLYGLNYLL